MKLFAVFFVLSVAMVGCNGSSVRLSSIENQAIDYRIEGDTYAVVVAVDNQVTKKQARQYARKRAAEITIEKGDRYFTIESETEVQVAKSSAPWPDNGAFYGNMYQELIVEKNFGRDSVNREMDSEAEVLPAVRLEFKIYKERPAATAIDACKLTSCG